MRTKIFCTIAAALVLAGCSNDNNETLDNWNGEIRLSSGVAVQQTRASGVPDTQIADGQQVGIFVSKTDNDAATYTGYTNVSATANGSGAFSSYSTTMYYPASGAGVKIIAYHPHNAATDDEYDFTVATDQATVANYYASDLLYSASQDYARSKTAHPLTFAHKLCKVVCTLAVGAGTPNITGATVEIVTPERAIKFHRTTGALATAATSQKADNVTLGSYGAIIPPQTFAKDAKFLKVTLQSGGELYYKIPNGSGDSDLALMSGNLYTFNITVNLTQLTVASTITPWTPVGEKDGTAEME